MILIRCNNGHYYDSSKFSGCPYCADKKDYSDVTVPLAQKNSSTKMEQTTAPVQEGAEQQESTVQTSPVQNSPFQTAKSQESAANQWRAPGDLANNWNAPEDENRTVSYYSRIIGSEPVVGWLVAIEGEYFGECFKLKSGRNFIGRSPEMDVQLSMDFAVSRKKHAVIIYEPKGRIFIAQPGESRELFYLNDEVVLNNVTMKQNDILLIGDTKLMFVPLCGKQFSWDDAKEKK